MRGRKLSACVAFVCALAVILAQDFGSVTGQVTDPSGAVVVGAGVQLSNPQTGYTRQSKTDLNGRYLFAGVPFGSYQLSVQSPGFVTYQQAISVSPKAAVKVDVVLNLGSVSETVEVRASGSVLNTASAQISGRARTKIPAQGIRRRSGKFNTEQYDSFQENEFAEAWRKPLSTFSADVDTASYSNVRRFLRDGELPPADSVRIEELINYFSYDYGEPAVDAPFSVTTGVAVCPWQPQHKLVHLGLRTRSVEVSKLPPANLVFLIDVSGSMDEPKKLPLVKESLRLLVEQLREQDRVGIVVYAGAAGMVLAPTPGNEKARILGVIDTLTPGGSTHGSQGIRLAYQLARESFLQNGNNRVILSTDGDFNVGVSSDGELVRLIEQERDAGIFLTVLGFGMGNYKDSKMEKLADHGNGNYAYIDSLREARKVLVEQMAGTLLTVAKDVKLQVEFNPARVKAYRLIGYENRILREEEFNDDKKDAGDLGAGTAVTALYEVIPAASREELPNVDGLRYQAPRVNTAASGGNELAMLKFRYKRPQESKSQLFTQPVLDSGKNFTEAGPEMRFAAAVAEYGLLLRQSKFAGSASFGHVLTVAQQTRGGDRNGYRAEFIDLVKTAQGLGRRDIE